MQLAVGDFQGPTLSPKTGDKDVAPCGFGLPHIPKTGICGPPRKDSAVLLYLRGAQGGCCPNFEQDQVRRDGQSPQCGAHCSGVNDERNKRS
jgi:hypothetical protein